MFPLSHSPGWSLFCGFAIASHPLSLPRSFHVLPKSFHGNVALFTFQWRHETSHFPPTTSPYICFCMAHELRMFFYTSFFKFPQFYLYSFVVCVCMCVCISVCVFLVLNSFITCTGWFINHQPQLRYSIVP